MISARRAALLGLDAALSAIMIAVLGLWPEAAEAPSVPLAGEPQGSLAAIAPRHRVRRWRRLFDVPNPAELLAALEAEDEELLLEAGAL